MDRRRFILAGGMTLATFGIARPVAASSARSATREVELERAPLASATPVATPDTLTSNTYGGDPGDLWRQPWEIGSDLVEIGCTIVQRFSGTTTEGYRLGLDGIVVQSVLYAQYRVQSAFFIGVNSDLSDLADARTLVVTGTYGGVQRDTSSNRDEPILIAHTIETP